LFKPVYETLKRNPEELVLNLVQELIPPIY
jgi:hypothetical protein